MSISEPGRMEHSPDPADAAYEILVSAGHAMNYRELCEAVLARFPMPQFEKARALAAVYTDINLDMRLVYMGDGNWGLREWAPAAATRSTPLTTKLGHRQDELETGDETEGLELGLEQEDIDVGFEPVDEGEEDEDTEVWSPDDDSEDSYDDE